MGFTRLAEEMLARSQERANLMCRPELAEAMSGIEDIRKISAKKLDAAMDATAKLVELLSGADARGFHEAATAWRALDAERMGRRVPAGPVAVAAVAA